MAPPMGRMLIQIMIAASILFAGIGTPALASATLAQTTDVVAEHGYCSEELEVGTPDDPSSDQRDTNHGFHHHHCPAEIGTERSQFPTDSHASVSLFWIGLSNPLASLSQAPPTEPPAA